MPVLQTFGNASVRGWRSGALANFELISTQLLSSTATSVSFSAITAGYKHLQLRYTAKNTSTTQTVDVTFNGASSGYAWHNLVGNGSTASSSAGTTQAFMRLPNGQSSSTTANAFGVGLIEILNYASGTTNTTIRALTGDPAQGFISLNSGFLASTSAITSITLSSTANSFAIGSRFSLYGMRG